MVRDIIYNGQSLQEMGLYLMKNQPFVVPSNRNLTSVSVKGSKVGDVIADDEIEQNIPLKLNFRTIPSKLHIEDEKLWLADFVQWAESSKNGYHRLYDTAREQGYFQKAWLTEVGEITRNFKGCYDISLSFSCQPYLYSELGQQKTTISTFSGNETITLFNPENYNSLPLIRVRNLSTTTGFTLTVNLTTLTFSECDGYVDIDSEVGNIFSGSTSLNDKVTGDSLPEFVSGNNTIAFTSTSGTFLIEITPRWRKK